MSAVAQVMAAMARPVRLTRGKEIDAAWTVDEVRGLPPVASTGVPCCMLKQCHGSSCTWGCLCVAEQAAPHASPGPAAQKAVLLPSPSSPPLSWPGAVRAGRGAGSLQCVQGGGGAGAARGGVLPACQRGRQELGGACAASVPARIKQAHFTTAPCPPASALTSLPGAPPPAPAPGPHRRSAPTCRCPRSWPPRSR